MMTFEEAHAKILALAAATTRAREASTSRGAPLGAERVALDDAAGRVLAEDVVTPTDMPRFDYSAMDGYAVRAADVTGAALPVAGESRTGVAPSAPLLPGTAWRIFTGAELPAGADAVVMQEEASREGGAEVAFASRPSPWSNVRRRGEDLAAGATAITRGTTLAPRHVALAASCDRAWLEVARRPVVAIVGTGDELRAPGTPDRPGSIPESNACAVRAMAIAAGALARVTPFLNDERAPGSRRARHDRRRERRRSRRRASGARGHRLRDRRVQSRDPPGQAADDRAPRLGHRPRAAWESRVGDGDVRAFRRAAPARAPGRGAAARGASARDPRRGRPPRARPRDLSSRDAARQ
jgi:hypothetical protein